MSATYAGGLDGKLTYSGDTFSRDAHDTAIAHNSDDWEHTSVALFVFPTVISYRNLGMFWCINVGLRKIQMLLSALRMRLNWALPVG